MKLESSEIQSNSVTHWRTFPTFSKTRKHAKLFVYFTHRKANNLAIHKRVKTKSSALLSERLPRRNEKLARWNCKYYFNIEKEQKFLSMKLLQLPTTFEINWRKPKETFSFLLHFFLSLHSQLSSETEAMNETHEREDYSMCTEM